MKLPDIAPPPFSTGPLKQVTDAELAMYGALIYERTGIFVSPRKQTLLSNRLRRRLRETGIDSFGDYYLHLKGLPADNPEWDAFLQEITTHETYLFRDEAQWNWFRRDYLPTRAAEPQTPPGPRSLRIWSAASSTGDEAFTAACCIASCLPGFRQWKVSILGTDIGIGAVTQARTATFGPRAMQLVPADYRRAYFTETQAGQAWQARPVLTEMVTFRLHNLMQGLRERPFDLVLLKNVMIYFDTTSKRCALANVLPLVRPGGMLLIGAAEGVSDLLKDYVRVQPWLYQKPKP